MALLNLLWVICGCHIWRFTKSQRLYCRGEFLSVIIFSSLMLLVRWQTNHLACKKSCSNNPKKHSTLESCGKNWLVKQLVRMYCGSGTVARTASQWYHMRLAGLQAVSGSQTSLRPSWQYDVTSETHLMHIYLKKNPAKFYPNRVWNDGAFRSGFSITS